MTVIGTGGIGYYQEEGQAAQIIRPGDVIEIPEGVKHWHGAAPGSWFSQIVIWDAAYVVPGELTSPLSRKSSIKLLSLRRKLRKRTDRAMWEECQPA